ncbi:MAG: CYTH domain-containing protein [Patescibacteria group bacterium]|jgi:adenylate cyclase class 2
MEEIEVKFLNIDRSKIERKLKKIGAKKIFDRTYRSKAFDFPDLRLTNNSSWARIRDEGEKITMAFKKRLGAKAADGSKNDEGMEEHEVAIDSFKSAESILLNLGLIEYFFEEKRRIRYLLDDAEVDIDICPALEPYLEIEASSWDKIDRVIALLELNPEDKKIFSATQIYRLAGIDMFDYKEFTFKGLVKR